MDSPILQGYLTPLNILHQEGQLIPIRGLDIHYTVMQFVLTFHSHNHKFQAVDWTGLSSIGLLSTLARKYLCVFVRVSLRRASPPPLNKIYDRIRGAKHP